MPKISVCATCYNHEKFLPEFVESVKAQSYSDWELIVVDDCSTDGSWNLLQKYAAQDSRIRVFQNDRNRHMCYSGNRAAEMARGELITVISCDDVFLPEKLESDCELMAQHPDMCALYNEPSVVVSEQTLSRSFPLPADFNRISLLSQELFGQNALTVPGLTVKRNVWNQVSGYNPLLRMTQDHDLHIKILEVGSVLKSPSSTVGYRLHDNNLSQRSECFLTAVANESVWLLSRHYLRGIASVKLAKELVPNHESYGHMTEASIPYFLARHALSCKETPCVNSAGYLALAEFMSDEGNRRILERDCDFLAKDFMMLSMKSAIGAAESDAKMRYWVEGLCASKSYRLGCAILSPFRAMKNIFGCERT